LRVQGLDASDPQPSTLNPHPSTLNPHPFDHRYLLTPHRCALFVCDRTKRGMSCHMWETATLLLRLSPPKTSIYSAHGAASPESQYIPNSQTPTSKPRTRNPQSRALDIELACNCRSLSLEGFRIGPPNPKPQGFRLEGLGV